MTILAKSTTSSQIRGGCWMNRVYLLKWMLSFRGAKISWKLWKDRLVRRVMISHWVFVTCMNFYLRVEEENYSVFIMNNCTILTSRQSFRRG